MIRSVCLSGWFFLAVTSLLMPAVAHGQVIPPRGFTAIFNGQDLSGWHAWAIHAVTPEKLAALSPDERRKQLDSWMDDARKHWRVENGELVNDGEGAYLTTDREFGDIELLIEYKTVAKADSGIYLRRTPQVQIWDYTKEGGKWDRRADKGSGGLYNNSPDSPGKEPLVLADKPFGQWNSFRIVQVGERTSVWLNEKLVVDRAVMENFWDRKRPLDSRGPILLQTHGGEIRWRNAFIREIPTSEANDWLSEPDDRAFTSLFNGKDLAGWQGDVESYEVQDGAIVCKPGKGGNLLTKDPYDDFVARMEFRLPPGGNNGLAIRFPGQGRPHLDGMCEIQVLDSEHEMYSTLDARQYHGSAYGMVAAHRGFLRPTGQWNYQQVTVRGSTIQVELNGVRILDADLSKVTEFKDNEQHPGKDLRSGFFGFAGHNDPVAFRNVRIQRLDPKKASTETWPQFRGLNASGLANSPARLPATIGPAESVVWKVAVPAGHSSPVVLGDRLFLTGERDDRLLTLCLDRDTGKTLWETAAPYERLETVHSIGNHAQTTPATDGQRVVSLFGSCGLFCYAAEDGAWLWQMPLGPFNNDFGAGSSPILVDDFVILCQDHDTDSFLMAIDKRTGQVVWRTDRGEFPRNYCTPVVWEVEGKKQIVVAATLRVVGYDLATGSERWTARGMARTVCMTPVIGDDNTLYAAGWAMGGDPNERINVEAFDEVLRARDENKNELIEESELAEGDIKRRFSQVDRDKSGSLTREEYDYFRHLFSVTRNVVMAIRPGGSGDVTKSHVNWEYTRHVPFCASPLVYNGCVFAVKDGGILTTLDAKTGAPLKTKRIHGNDDYYSSPVGGDGKVYLVDREGKLTVVSAEAEWTVISVADFGEAVYSTPALVGGRVYLRTEGHMYCFGS